MPLLDITRVDLLYKGWGEYHLLHYTDKHGVARTHQVDHHGSAACVFVYDEAKRSTVLCRQIRPPMIFARVDERLLEAPAGIIHDETEEECAVREAMEEVGVALKSLDYVGNFWTQPGLSTERIALFLGSIEGRSHIGGGLQEEGEDINVVELPLAEVATYADTGQVTDIKTFAAIQTLRIRRPDLF